MGNKKIQNELSASSVEVINHVYTSQSSYFKSSVNSVSGEKNISLLIVVEGHTLKKSSPKLCHLLTKLLKLCKKAGFELKS